MHSALTYTLLDLGGSLWGTVVFAVAALAPGYVLGRAADVTGFRQRSAPEQLAWSLALSLGAGTVVIVAATWVVGVAATGLLLVLITTVALAMFLRSGDHWPRLKLEYVVFAGWALFVLLSLTDIGLGSRLWMSVTTFDHSVRVPFVDAVMRTGIPPVNPLYWPGHDAPLRYYYFWYVTCAVIAKLAHISARQALMASCVWPLAGVVAMLALYGKHLLGWQGTVLRTRTRIAVSLMAVTGLDLLLVALVWSAGRGISGDMEWWSIDQVTSWLDTFLWVPHHAVALVCCLLCFLLVWMARFEATLRQRVILGVLAGLCFASAFGLSTYIAIAFTLVMAAWLLRLFLTTRNPQQMTALAIAACVAAVVLAPYVMQLMRLTPSSAGGGAATHVLAFGVREMLDPRMAEHLPGIAALAPQHPFAQREAAALVLLAPGYFLEFGFFLVVAVVAWRWREKSEGERTLLYLLAAALVSITFLRSTVIATNDYGVRASLLAQFFLLLLGARVWESSSGARRLLLGCLAAIGLCGTAYQAVVLRLYLPQQQRAGNAAMRELSEREYAMRDAYAQFTRAVPGQVRLQYGAPAGGYFDATHTLNAQRQIIAAGATGTDCNTGFGGEVAACGPMRETGTRLFGPASGAGVSGETARSLCAGIGAQYLVATRWDAVWLDSHAWPWTLPPAIVTPDVRIVACQAN